MRAHELIDWFWREFAMHRQGDFGPESLCQCTTENLIERCDNPERMRAFLLVAVAIDQAVRPILGSDYPTFRGAFRFPRLAAHGMEQGEASSDWLIYEYHRFHEKMDWRVGAEVGSVLISSVRDWFSLNDERGVAWPELATELGWLPSRFGRYDQPAAELLTRALDG